MEIKPENMLDKLERIFLRQMELMQKYHPIEEANGFHVPAVPVDINEPKSQQRIKDFFWRVTEELIEAVESLYDEGAKTEDFHEELIDALHFFVEACIIAGVQLDKLTDISTNPDDYLDASFDIIQQTFGYPNEDDQVYTEDVEVFAYDVICELAKAAHLLKNRPWKQSWVSTNVPMFTEYMSRAYYSFIRLFVVAGLNATDVFEIYFKKAQVNQHRQETGY